MSVAIKRRLMHIYVIVIDIGYPSWSMTMHYLPRTSYQCELHREYCFAAFLDQPRLVFAAS